MVVLEKITAPASRNRAAGGASTAAGTSLTLAAPSGTGTPLVAILALMVTGQPPRRPAGLGAGAAERHRPALGGDIVLDGDRHAVERTGRLVVLPAGGRCLGGCARA